MDMMIKKRREKPLKEKRYLYYIYNNLYVHVRDSVDDFDDFDDHKPAEMLKTEMHKTAKVCKNGIAFKKHHFNT